MAASQWTIPLFNRIFIFAKKSKSFTEARKSMLKLVKLTSLVAKYCKTWKIYACKVCKFCILLYYAYHKMAELPMNFATKLVSFTNFNMLFLASVKDFDFFAKMKIQFKRGMVHCMFWPVRMLHWLVAFSKLNKSE